MNPLPLILLLVGGAVVWSITRTAKAVINLNYNVLRFGIYRFATDGNLVLRLRMRFTNPQNTPLHINLFDIAAYLNSSTSYDSNGNLVVNNRGTMIASLTDTQGFVIQANNYTDKDFFINVRWADVGRYFLTNIVSIISTITNAQSINDVISVIVGRDILISGVVKAENITIPVNSIVQLTDDRNS